MTKKTTKRPTPSYPTVALATLSKDARAVYAHAGHSPRVDRDLLDPKAARSYVTREDADAFQPSQRLLTAIEELVAARYATYSAKYKQLQIQRVHPLYTVGAGDGAYRIEIRVVPIEYARRPGNEGALLAVLDGADMRMDQGDGAWAAARIEAAHPTATDFEHDRVKAARLEVVGPALVSMYGPRIVYAGTLAEARLYPLGTDVLAQSDGDTSAGWCDGTSYGSSEPTHEPHPFAPYLPPERADVSALCPSIVTIEMTPRRSAS